MRWQGQTLTAEDPNALPGLQTMAGLVRSVQTPEFAGAGAVGDQAPGRGRGERLAQEAPNPLAEVHPGR